MGLEEQMSALEAAFGLVEEKVQGLQDEVTLLKAALRYQAGFLTAGEAAVEAGVPKLVFLQRMGDFGVPAFDISKEELERDVAAAWAASRKAHGEE